MSQYAPPPRSRPSAASFLGIALVAFLAGYGLGLFEPDIEASTARDRLVWLYTGMEREVRGILARPVPARWRADSQHWGFTGNDERYHRVRLGDTLPGIAKRYGIEHAALLERNGIGDPDEVDVGHVIVIPPPASDPETLTAVEAQLRLAEREVREARFEEALRTTQAIEQLLIDGPAASGDDDARTRLELIRATAHIALGNAEQVQQALRRALAASPGLELDRATTAPKLLRAFETARAQPTG